MASAAPASTNVFTSLPPRPPTPPREAVHEGEVSLKSLLGCPGLSDPQSSLRTPPTANTPVSSGATDSNPKSSRTRKKVVWSAHTEYKEPSDYRKSGKLLKSSPLLAPPSAYPKPIKGILKPSSPNPRISSLSAEFDGSLGQPNIVEMLDSTIKQLAGPDRDSKLDAYMVLARALKASNNLPDRVALRDKMSLFMQFIQRDVTSKNDDGTLDTSLINHALTLLATFLHFPAIATTLTPEFGIFIFDHSVRFFEDVSVPKDVVRHLMQVVAFQDFPAKVMTSDRVGRLVTALHQIEYHLTGKSIIMGRIHIYKRLVKQARSHMLSHSSWLKDMFTDMLSTVKDIRAQAINLATEAGFALRPEKQLMRRTSEIFQMANEDQSYIEFYMHRLQDMLKDKQYSSVVPQIWSAVILYMRCPLERWQYYGPWLTLVQSAFNMADSSTKQEANYAWNRYVYLALVDSKIAPKALGTICQPLTSQLRRKANPKQLEEAAKLRTVVIGGICNLYYYAFAPGNRKYSCDVVWDVAVQPIMAQLVSLDGKPEIPGDCLTQASRMLAGLLDVATPRVWRQDRIIETPPVKPDELPAIDSKWARRNCDKIFHVVGPILEKKFTDLANKETLTFRLWHVMVGSVAAASAKDIKVSEDTSKFFAYTFGLLSKIWMAGTSGDSYSNNLTLLSSVKNFIGVLVDALGMLPFTEKKLSMTVANSFEPITTPSHNPDRADEFRGVVRTPLQHLFSMLCSVPPGGTDDAALSDFFLAVFELFFNGKPTKSRIELAHELLQLLPWDSLSPYGPWLLATQNISLSLESDGDTSLSSSVDSNKILGPRYREIASLLERGLTAHPNLPSDHWLSLFERLSEHVAKEFGDAGRALIIVEPLAKVLIDGFGKNRGELSAMSLKATQALFQVAKLPRDRAALEIARRRLWGTPLTAVRGGTVDIFDGLYNVSNHVLETLYNTISDLDTSFEIGPFLESFEGFLIRCFSQTGINALSKFQKGLCLWIQDERCQLQLGNDAIILKTLGRTMDQISTVLAGCGQLSKDDFDQIEPLLTASFQSKHLSILGKAVETWNAIAKDEEKLECSDSLRSIVSSLGSRVELLISGEDQSSGGFGAQASSFVQPQEDTSFVVLSSTSSHQDAQQLALSSLASVSTDVSKRPLIRKRRMESTPEMARAKSAKRTNTVRLRHENSQIQFAPIVSSSPPQDESQHLTERQKEVRERQRVNTTLNSNTQTNSPPRFRKSPPKDAEEPATGDDGEAEEVTPRRAASYDNLTSLTPTPRRGQFLQLDDNDPPSSPPVPRPCPLLSEIQSRSRASRSLDNWEFSSPSGSPVTGHQQAAHDIEQVSRKLTYNANHVGASEATKNKQAEAAISTSMELIPSSVASVEEEASDTDMFDESMASLPNQEETPTTPNVKHRKFVAATEESPKSGDDEFVDARSSPEELSSPPQKRTDGSKDTSFALSEGDESHLMKIVVELESRRGNVDESEGDALLQQQKKTGAAHARGCITIRREESSSPSPPKTRSATKQADLPAMIPSTPVKATHSTAERKRKRSGSKHNGVREKKRQSESEGTAERVGALAQVRDKSNSPTPILRRSTRRFTGVETRISGQRRDQQRQEEEEAKMRHKRPSKRSRKRQGGDTDDEVLSQLVTESNASSQGQPQQDSNGQGATCINNGEMEATGPIDSTVADKVEIVPRATGGNNSVSLTIMETLQGGLERLRKAALSRDDVYKMEDMLMDMKRELFEAERRGRERQ